MASEALTNDLRHEANTALLEVDKGLCLWVGTIWNVSWRVLSIASDIVPHGSQHM